jgi:hypothetical protein
MLLKRGGDSKATPSTSSATNTREQPPSNPTTTSTVNAQPAPTGRGEPRSETTQPEENVMLSPRASGRPPVRKAVSKPATPQTAPLAKSRAEGVVSEGASASAAMARAERALGGSLGGGSTSGTGEVVLETRVPETISSKEVQRLQNDISSIKKAYEALEKKYNESTRAAESYAREKSVIELNVDRLKTDLRNQYKENAQIKPLQLELAELKIKYERLRKEGPGTTSNSPEIYHCSPSFFVRGFLLIYFFNRWWTAFQGSR